MLKVLGLSLYGTRAASARYRLAQYIPGLLDYGISLDVNSLLGNEYIRKTYAGEMYPMRSMFNDYRERIASLFRQRAYDVAILHLELFPLLPGIIESRLLRIPYVYDFDDAFFVKYKADRFKFVSFVLENKFDAIVSRAAAVTAGNQFLVDYAKHWNPKTVWLPTVVDTDRYIYSPNKCNHVFTIGWIGSPSTSVYLSELTQPLADLGREGAVRFVVIGGHCPPIEGVDVVYVPWSEETEVNAINTFDVGVMPLFDDEWSKGKCALKLLQYMACGVPVVASPVGANLDVVDESSGVFASDREGWGNCLRRLRDDLSLRREMGQNGRRRVEGFYSLRRALPIMAKTIGSVVANGKRAKAEVEHC